MMDVEERVTRYVELKAVIRITDEKLDQFRGRNLRFKTLLCVTRNRLYEQYLEAKKDREIQRQVKINRFVEVAHFIKSIDKKMSALDGYDLRIDTLLYQTRERVFEEYADLKRELFGE